jgi:hypothetical protein
MLNFTVLGHHCNPSWNLSFTISSLIKLETHVFSECGPVAHSTFKICCSFSQTEEMLQICKHIQPSRSVAPLLLKMKSWSYPPPPPHEHYYLYSFSVCCFSSVQILPLRKNQKKKKMMMMMMNTSREEEEDAKMLLLSIAADHLPVSNLKMKKS